MKKIAEHVLSHLELDQHVYDGKYKELTYRDVSEQLTDLVTEIESQREAVRARAASKRK